MITYGMHSSTNFNKCIYPCNHIPNQDTEHFYHQVTSNPLVGIPCTVLRLYTFTAKGQSLIPGQGTKFPQIMQHGQNQKQ